MAVLIGSARIDERGKATGGQAGDQTGNEVSTQNWYARSEADVKWVCIRHRDATVREKIAHCMELACMSKHIGYDQYDRLTLYNALKDKGFDIERLDKDVETDCSALVRVCLAYAGVMVDNFTTYNEKTILSKQGNFDIYTDDSYAKSSAKLMRGDILVTSKKGHTVVVLSDGVDIERELGSRELKKGMSGNDVKVMQEILIKSVGYNMAPYGADGDFGAKTEECVKHYKTNHMHEKNADGVATIKMIQHLIDNYRVQSAGETELAKPIEHEKWDKTVVITGNSVNERIGNGANFTSIGIVKKGNEYKYVATSANNWIAIEDRNCVYWVSGQYAKVK